MSKCTMAPYPIECYLLAIVLVFEITFYLIINTQCHDTCLISLYWQFHEKKDALFPTDFQLSILPQ